MRGWNRDLIPGWAGSGPGGARILLTITLLIAAAAAVPASAGDDDGRIPIPGASEQTLELLRLKDTYKEQYAQRAPGDVLALAARFLDLARDPAQSSPALRFTLLSEARDLAARAGGARIALDAARELERQFQVDGPAMMMSVMEAVAPLVREPGDAAAVIEGSFELSRGALCRDDFDTALKFLSKLPALLRVAKNDRLRLQLKALAEGVAEAKKEHRARSIEQVRKALGEDPASPRANAEAGKYLCFIKGRWREGLPLLGKGDDPTLKILSEMELQGAADPADRLVIADGWWKVSAGRKGLEKGHLQVRAARWYCASLPELSAVDRDRTILRLEEFAPEYERTNISALRDPEDADLVVALFNGENLNGWEPISGSWRVQGRHILRDPNPTENQNLQSLERAVWHLIAFEFQGGNPGIYLTESAGRVDGPGINLDSDQKNNGEIRRPVDMRIWNTVRMERTKDALQVRLNGEPVYSFHPGDSGRYLTVKAWRTQLRIRRLLGIGLPSP